MDQMLPRIERVEPTLTSQVAVTWRPGAWPDGATTRLVDLDGWIATGGPILAPLRERSVFLRAAVGEHGASVTWDDGEGDLSIDAFHLLQISREQQPFAAAELAGWQAEIGISNSEAAGLFDVSPSTWSAYKAGTTAIPHAIRLVCRSVLRDPLTLHAWLHPARPRGRPRREHRMPA